MKFEYPSKGIKDKDASKNYGGQNSFGFYPINRFNAWHGGIHIEGWDKQIQAIADGKVIAYRLAQGYSEEKLGGTSYLYSNGFVLIEHEYVSPKGQILTFYSLYMHLMPVGHIWNTKRHSPVIFTKRTGKVKGLNARDTHNAIRFVIPEGDDVTVDTNLTEKEKSSNHWSHQKSSLGIDYKYRKVRYTDLNATIHTQIFISTHPDKATAIGGGKFKIKTHEDEGDAPEAFSFYVKSTNRDKIISCNIPVKAGANLGYPGTYAFEKNPKYMAAHVEIFTADDVNNFLSDAKGDGFEEKNKNYLKVKSGAVLKKAYPGKIPSGSKIKVNDETQLCEVQLVSVTKTVLHKDIKHTQKINDQDHYHPNHETENFNRLNSQFGGLLNKNSDLVRVEDFVEGSPERKVSFTPTDTKKYWAFADIVPQGTEELRNLYADLTEIYEYEHKPDPARLKDTVTKEFILPKKNLRKVKDTQGTEWLFVEGKDQSGWIKENDSKLEKISAYNWVDFGFKVIKDNADDFVYDPKSPPQFLQDVWAQIDTNRDKILDANELHNALQNEELSERFSRMVCLHTSEWDYSSKIGSFKARVKEIFREGIDQEDENDKKKEYEAKRDELLHELEKRVEKLSFWKEIKPVIDKEKENKAKENKIAENKNKELQEHIKNKPVIEIIDEKQVQSNSWFNILSPKKPEQGPVQHHSSPVHSQAIKPAGPATPQAKYFPVGNSKVYHFHPIAFVEQMRRLDSCCKIDEEYFFINYAKYFPDDLLTNEKKEIFTLLFDSINDYYNSEGRCCQLKQIAYMLATAKHETGNTFQPIQEYGNQNYFEKKYDAFLGSTEGRRARAIKYENTEPGDGVKYRGRGFVQITYKINYRKMQNKFGINLVDTPDNALKHSLAVKIMIYGSEKGKFTGVKLDDFINSTKTDYINARKVINGLDMAETIAEYASKIEKCLKIN